MHLIFVDDSTRKLASSPYNRRLVAAGAVLLESGAAHTAEREIGTLCRAAGFPDGAEFKWSPAKTDWMHDHLKAQDRLDFQTGVVDILRRNGANVIFVGEVEGNTATQGTTSSDEDVLALLMERVEMRVSTLDGKAMVISDRPGGGVAEDKKFVGRQIELLLDGTRFVSFEHISFFFTGESDHVRLLQAADLVASCCSARVAGESVHSPPVFDLLVPMMHRSWCDAVGGTSFKLYPDWMGNLYHWLLDEQFFHKGLGTLELPHQSWPYKENEQTY